MPGDLSDPTQLYPFHYDPRYEPGKNTFEPGSPNLEGYLQDIAFQVLGRGLDKDRMSELIAYLEGKGFLHRNWGDESFRNEVIKYLNKIKYAGKVARKWLT